MTEEEKFAKHLEQDTTFWGDLFRERKAKTFQEARDVAERFCREARASNFRSHDQAWHSSVDYLSITRASAAQ